MKMIETALVSVAGICAALSLSIAHAGGFYVGGALGDATIEDSSGTTNGASFDESDSAYRLFGGYRFDALPLVSISAEAGYRDLGSPNNASREYNVSGLDFSALAGVGLGPLEVYGRIGNVQYDLEKITAATRFEFDGSAALYGIGARISILSLALRAEYEQVDIKELDKAEMLWISLLYQF